MGIFLAFFVVVSLVCLVLLVKIKLKQRRSQVSWRPLWVVVVGGGRVPSWAGLSLGGKE